MSEEVTEEMSEEMVSARGLPDFPPANTSG
jgi:hypothetical protein